MKINKKYLMFAVFGIFAIGLVSAIAYYAVFSNTFTVVSAISIVGEATESLENVYSNSSPVEIIGTPITITNNAPSERTINIGNNAPTKIDVRYMGTLTLEKKDTTTWDVMEGSPQIIKYTIVGKDFIVEDIPEEMTLIYYPDTQDGWLNNIANIQILEITNNLPIALDVGDDYCGNTYNLDATQCVGAKLWLLPGVLDITQARNLVTAWGTNAPNFLFETKLIQYNVDGNIVMSGNGNNLTITPVYTIAPYTTGEYTITTTIA